MTDGREDLDRAARERARQSQAEERASLVELHRRLRAMTPYAFGTGAIVAANVAVFALMVASGVHALSPTSQSLIHWGANYGPKVSAGQWWRLLTAMFVHVGALHIAMNMWGLWNIGRFIERALGTMTYVVVYVLSGWAGSVVSVLMKPMTVSAGASGAIFGVFGVLLAFVLRPRRSVPVAALRPLRGSVFSFLAINLWLGIKIPSIDLAAHGGGLVCGFLLGAVLSHELTREARRAANRRTALLGTAVAIGLGIASWTLRSRVPDFEATLERFGTVEHRAFSVYNEASEKNQDGKLSDQDFADVIERDVLPPWKSLRIDSAAYRDAPRAVREFAGDLENYREVREQAWQLIAHGLRASDAEEIERGMQKQREADTMVEAMSKRTK